MHARVCRFGRAFRPALVAFRNVAFGSGAAQRGAHAQINGMLWQTLKIVSPPLFLYSYT